MTFPALPLRQSCVLLLLGLGVPGLHAAGFTVVRALTSATDGANSHAPLMQANDSLLYGTTSTGGANGGGTLFSLTMGGNYTVLRALTTATDGGAPTAGLAQGSNDSMLYGTAYQGGANGGGTVFRMYADGSGFQVLRSFTIATDGGHPNAGLANATNTRLYGTTTTGGTGGSGTIYAIRQSGGIFSLLYSFNAATDGAAPLAGLIWGSDNKFYGTTSTGGPNGGGTIFSINTSGTFTVLRALTSATDGGAPAAALLQAADGKLYGTTVNGGANGAGTIFRINLDGSGFTVLRSLTAATDGFAPSAALVQAADGKLYGTIAGGGANGAGTLFSLNPDGTGFTVLRALTSATDGDAPIAGLVEAIDGKLYGTTYQGGAHGVGTLFTYAPNRFPTANAGGPYTLTTGGSIVLNGALSNDPDGDAISYDWDIDGDTVFGDLTGARPPLLWADLTLAAGSYTISLRVTDSHGATHTATAPLTVVATALAVHAPFRGPADAARGPEAGLIQASDGMLYGTTYTGGATGSGTVFRVNPDGSGFTVMHSFAYGTDGGTPYAGLVQATDGKLYGTTYQGGGNNIGTVFSLTLSGTFAVLHTFSSAYDGSYPRGGLIQASDGTLYGTTFQGGEHGGGTIFSLTTGGGFIVQHALSSATDGSNPSAGLVQASDGKLYGTTLNGGANNGGTIFSLTIDGTFTVLHSLNANVEGGLSEAVLVQASDGKLYGTALHGGPNNGGTIFSITTGGTFAVVRSLSYASDGATPQAGLILASDGKLYGTTGEGGTYGVGTVFSLTTSGTYTVLHSLNAISDGAYPYAGLVQASDGSLYGTTLQDGPAEGGTIFSLTTDGTFTTRYSFPNGPEGANPLVGLAQGGNDGMIYGTTFNGGAGNAGTVFRMNTSGSAFGVLRAFTPGTDGGYPKGVLVSASNGRLYGTTYAGGTSGCGTIYSIRQSGGIFSLLYTFSLNSDGGSPVAGLTVATDGKLYGTTSTGGPNGAGTIFSITTGGTFTVLRSLTAATDGGTPSAALLQATDGKLYGTTTTGGANAEGTIFSLNLDGSGFTVLRSFTRASDGATVLGRLVQAGDGRLYGTASAGGATGYGTLFSLNPDGSGFTVVRALASSTDGSAPNAGLILATDGKFYGTTSADGPNGSGTLFSLTTGGTFTVLRSFAAAAEGTNPYAGLLQATNGKLYGATYSAGPTDAGTLFVYTIPVSNLTDQTITFGSLGNRSYGSPPFALSATASSGLPVTFSVNSGPATILGNMVTLTGPGFVHIKASQAGDTSYNPAPDVYQGFTVTTSFLSWQESRFTAGELADTSRSGPNAIYGSDGLTNLVKYALGLEPGTNYVIGLPVLTTTATDWVYTYTRPSYSQLAVTDLTYEVEVSTNLTTWTTVGVTHELVLSSGGVDTWRGRYPLASAANVHFRLKITRTGLAPN